MSELITRSRSGNWLLVLKFGSEEISATASGEAGEIFSAISTFGEVAWGVLSGILKSGVSKGSLPICPTFKTVNKRSRTAETSTTLKAIIFDLSIAGPEILEIRWGHDDGVSSGLYALIRWRTSSSNCLSAALRDSSMRFQPSTWPGASKVETVSLRVSSSSASSSSNSLICSWMSW